MRRFGRFTDIAVSSKFQQAESYMSLHFAIKWFRLKQSVAFMVLFAASFNAGTLAADAVKASGEPASPSANARVQQLVQQLKSPVESVRLKAVQRLGALGAAARPAVSHLRALGGDESDRVYLGAEIALKQILNPANVANHATGKTNAKNKPQVKEKPAARKVPPVDPAWLSEQPAPTDAEAEAAEPQGLTSYVALVVNLFAFLVVVGAALFARKYWGQTSAELADPELQLPTNAAPGHANQAANETTQTSDAKHTAMNAESDAQPATIPFNDSIAASVASAVSDASSASDDYSANEAEKQNQAEQLSGPVDRKSGIFAPPDAATRETLSELTALLGNPTPEVRFAAVGDLAQLGLASVPVLIKLLDDRDPQIRRTVMATLSGIGLAAAPQLLEASEAFRATKEVDEGDLSETALRQYVQQLSVGDPEQRRRAVTGLAAGGSRAMPHLISALGDSDPEVRRRSTASIGRIGDSSLQTIHALELLLSDNNHEVRAGAASTLGTYGMRGIPSLFKALDDSDPEVRKRATHCLNSIGMSAIPMIVQHLDDSIAEVDESKQKVTARADVFTKRQQISSLAASGVSALPELITELSQRDDETRRRAISALGRIGEPASVAIPSLRTMLLDRNPEVRRAVVSALGWMNASAVPLLSDALMDQDIEVKLRALASLARFQAEAAPALDAIVELLTDSSPRIKEEAVRTLGCLGLAALSCVGKVQRLTLDENAHIRAAAMHAINRIGPMRRAA